MSAHIEETFRLSWRSPFVTVSALCFSIIAIFALPHYVLLLSLLLQFFVFLGLLLLMSVFTVSPSGIVLYRVNRLQWSQVSGVRRVSVFGLPYLLIKRSKGFSWWLPLYFTGSRSISAVLAENAPANNPLNVNASLANT